jgi:hypothetical protein
VYCEELGGRLRALVSQSRECGPIRATGNYSIPPSGARGPAQSRRRFAQIRTCLWMRISSQNRQRAQRGGLRHDGQSITNLMYWHSEHSQVQLLRTCGIGIRTRSYSDHLVGSLRASRLRTAGSLAVPRVLGAPSMAFYGPPRHLAQVFKI